MRNWRDFMRLFENALGAIDELRFFKNERGYQGELLAELRARLPEAGLPGDPIVEQEYQKTIPHHNLKIRPDLIVHVPFERGETASRKEGNFVAVEIKRDRNDVKTAFDNLRLMATELRYPLTLFVMVDSENTYASMCPARIAGQTVCYAVSLRDGEPVIRRRLPRRRRPAAVRKRVVKRPRTRRVR